MTRRYRPDEQVDFVIVGAGAAGGVMARELSRAGFSVVVLEQGPWFKTPEFRHDELAVMNAALTNNHKRQPNTRRESADQPGQQIPSVLYGQGVGGGTVHFTGNYWRFHEIDFVEASQNGTVSGASLADWPFDYAELEPYYTKVEWEIGVSGQAGGSPFDPPRSRPYPVPPLPIHSKGVLMELGARKLGWHPFPAPLAIISEPYRGRAACVHCGFCENFGCEMEAKSSTLVTLIPEAVATGRCEIRPESYVRKVEVDRRGRVTGVRYFNARKREIYQRAKAVILCANGAETPRLLLLSKSGLFPDGLANHSGLVGRNLMFNSGSFAGARFEREVNGYRSVVNSRVIHDFYEMDPKLGISGGGGLDLRFDFQPIAFALYGQGDTGGPRWGAEFKRQLHQRFTHTAYALGHSTSLPVESNTISLDPSLKDAWGLPALQLTFREHPNDHRLSEFLLARSLELLEAAGAVERWSYAPGPAPYPQVHLLGTCRMGNDAARSVVDRDHRAHDVPNLFMVDGSSFVTSGRGQPTMTIQALAFRAADRITALARRGEI